MDLVIDASSVINLDNAKALETVSKLSRCRLWLSPLVVGECEPTCAQEILSLKAAGAIHFVETDSIPADLFLQLLDKHGLGEGETECLALCISSPFDLCCDDRRARSVGIELLGSARVVGSLRLLQWCVAEEILLGQDAFEFYRRMKEAGGFLPDVSADWFSS